MGMAPLVTGTSVLYVTIFYAVCVFSVLLAVMFGKKAFGKKKEASMCPMHNAGGDLPMTEDKKSDPMAKYTRMTDDKNTEKKGNSSLIMVALTVLSLGEVVLFAQLAMA